MAKGKKKAKKSARPHGPGKGKPDTKKK